MPLTVLCTSKLHMQFMYSVKTYGGMVVRFPTNAYICSIQTSCKFPINTKISWQGASQILIFFLVILCSFAYQIFYFYFSWAHIGQSILKLMVFVFWGQSYKEFFGLKDFVEAYLHDAISACVCHMSWTHKSKTHRVNCTCDMISRPL